MSGFISDMNTIAKSFLDKLMSDGNDENTQAKAESGKTDDKYQSTDKIDMVSMMGPEELLQMAISVDEPHFMGYLLSTHRLYNSARLFGYTQFSYMGATPLHLAASCGSTKCVKALVTHGARTDIKDDGGLTPLERVPGGAEFNSTRDALLLQSMDPPIRSAGLGTPLSTAAADAPASLKKQSTQEFREYETELIMKELKKHEYWDNPLRNPTEAEKLALANKRIQGFYDFIKEHVQKMRQESSSMESVIRILHAHPTLKKSIDSMFERQQVSLIDGCDSEASREERRRLNNVLIPEINEWWTDGCQIE